MPTVEATSLAAPQLQRSLGPFAVTVYGIGTIVGAGIFVLLGKLIGAAGNAAPLAFGLAAVVAGLTGLSYAQLASRLPFSAGEAVYVDTAFGRRWLTLLVGLAVAISGILSSATIAHGFAAYLNVLLPTPPGPTAILYLLILGGIAISGIRETAWVVGVIAISSTLGLIVVGGLIVQGDPDWHWPKLSISLDASVWSGILLGAFLAFYALIGFEDLVNLAEEMHQPGRTLSIAIPASLAFATVLYVGLAIVALGAAPVEALAATDAPMAFLLDNSGLPGLRIIVVLSIVAITNGALAQLVMSARVLYGLGNRGLLPAPLALINTRTRTPVIASLLVISLVLAAVSSGTLLELARVTSGLVLVVFTLVNLSLLVLNWRAGSRGFTRLFTPGLAAMACMLLLASQIPS